MNNLSKNTGIHPLQNKGILSQENAAPKPAAASTIQASQSRAGLWLAALLIVLIGLALLIGRYPSMILLSPSQLSTDVLAQRLVFNLRLPRILTAVLLGMSLSGAGAVMQMLFGNPLVEPGFLGVTQGASFGAALCIITFSHSIWVIQGSAAAFALAGLGLSYLLAQRVRFGGWVLRLVLAGIAISALFSSGVGVLKYLADPLTQLPEITFWLLGSLAALTWPQLLAILPAVIVGLAVMYRMRWRLNLLSLNDETAFSLGAAPGRERTLLLVAAVLAVAAVTAVAGMVGWVGLILPHLARRLTRADARYSLPTAMLLGGIFTVICDTLARTILAGEIPLGIITSFFGAGAFIFLMIRQRLPVQS